MGEAARLRIGELSKRVGVSPELLRAWETRYRLVDPARTPGGLRLYSAEDERRVREMRRQIENGLSAAEAARTALGVHDEATAVEELLDDLDGAVAALDEPMAQRALDRAFQSLDLESAIGRLILPFLHGLGERWAAAERTVAQEHFATNVIGGRLRALARGWGDGTGRCALLACPPGEQHDMGMLCFGLVLHKRGWRIVYLGAETPIADLLAAATAVAPELIVLGATDAHRFIGAAEEIRALGAETRVAIGGAGASEAVAASLRAELLADDLVAAARVASGTAPTAGGS